MDPIDKISNKDRTEMNIIVNSEFMSWINLTWWKCTDGMNRLMLELKTEKTLVIKTWFANFSSDLYLSTNKILVLKICTLVLYNAFWKMKYEKANINSNFVSDVKACFHIGFKYFCFLDSNVLIINKMSVVLLALVHIHVPNIPWHS